MNREVHSNNLATMDKLPVSIISPVRNCIREMPSHAAYLRRMAAAVSEIIVVDSDSTDGTRTFLEVELADLDVIFLNHPPGLYESWNDGISHATQHYCTVATVGDPLPPSSLPTLIASMERFSADVVITAPQLLDSRQLSSPKRWPIHHFIAATEITRPTEIPSAAWLALTLGLFPGNLLSSSAGNLYRTDFLQKNPFPTQYGHAGDCAWSLQMSLTARWVIDPTTRSYFTIHHPSAHRKRRCETKVRAMTALMTTLISESRLLLQTGGIPFDLLELLKAAPDVMLEKALIQIQIAKERPTFLRIPSLFGTPLNRRRKSLERLIQKRQEATLEFARSTFRPIVSTALIQ